MAAGMRTANYSSVGGQRSYITQNTGEEGTFTFYRSIWLSIVRGLPSGNSKSLLLLGLVSFPATPKDKDLKFRISLAPMYAKTPSQTRSEKRVVG